MRRLTLAAVIALGAASVMQAQTVTPNGDGTYTVIVGRDTLLAITRAMMVADLKRSADLKTAQATIATQDSLLRAYARNRQAADTVIARDSAMIKLQGDQIADLKTDVELHKEKLRRTNPFFSVDFGVGANLDGLTVNGALGLRQVRLGVTGQQGGLGAFAGYRIPLPF